MLGEHLTSNADGHALALRAGVYLYDMLIICQEIFLLAFDAFLLSNNSHDFCRRYTVNTQDVYLYTFMIYPQWSQRWK